MARWRSDREARTPRRTGSWRAFAMVLWIAAVVVGAGATCDPAGTGPAIPNTPATLTKAPCKPTLATDTFTDEGIDTRTGCMLVTMTLGAAMGAADLSLPVAMIRNEGNVPSADLYPSAWFGVGVWLNIDEYVTREKEGAYTLHSPNGDVVYDYQVRIPYAGYLDAGDERNSTLYRAYRTRPFDGTFLWEDEHGFHMLVGNPADSRSLRKHYWDALPAAQKGSSAKLLTRVEKASIYKGPLNYIDIKRKYDKDGVSVDLSSSLYAGSGLLPLSIKGPVVRDDGKAGHEIQATSTLLHGWKSATRAILNDKGNVERLASMGRNEDEEHTTTFTWWNEDKPEQTVLKSMLEEEGSADDMRTLESLELTERADGASATWPFAVKTMVDHARPGADMTHVVSECDRQTFNEPALAKYFTFNYANGTSAAYEYADGTYRNMVLRTKDAMGREIRLVYNYERGGGIPGQSQPATAFELHYMTVKGEGGPDQLYMYRYDRFSADTYRVPMVGKVSIPKSVGDKQVIYRAVFGDKEDEFNNKRWVRTFDVPRGVAGVDGRTRWEYRGLDGFTYESWDENAVMVSFRWVDQDKNADGTYDKETIDTFVMGTRQARMTRDRFGRLLQKVDSDPTLADNQQPTTKYNITKEGFTDKIEDTGSGDVFTVTSWNAPRSAITGATLTNAGKEVISYSLPADDLGNPEGAGSVKLGPVTLKTSTKRIGAGLLASTSITGPNGQTLTTELGYADKDVVPSTQKLNGQKDTAATPKPMTAKGGCK